MKPTWMPLVLALTALAGCRHVGFEDSTFTKQDTRYHVGPLGKGWHRIFLEDNDLAFSEDGRTGRAIAVNSTCKGHDDPPLAVLTRHLLMGFTDRQQESEKLIPMDEREAMRSHHTARLDGVPVELELVVLKKDGCVYDFSYVAPAGQAAARMGDFDAVLAGFHAERVR